MERYYHIVSIMLRYMNQLNASSENLCCHKVKIDKILGVTFLTFLSNATTFRNDYDNNRSVRMKQRKYESRLGMDHTNFETPRRPRKEYDFDVLRNVDILVVHAHPKLLVISRKL